MNDDDTDRIDYRTIEVPPDKPAEDYTFAERRADILHRIEDAGHPGLVNGAELARQYGVTRQSVYNDFDVLADYVKATVGDRVDLTINSVFRRAIRGLLEQKEYRAAAKTAADYGDWVRDRHELQEIFDRLEAIEEQQDTSL